MVGMFRRSVSHIMIETMEVQKLILELIQGVYGQ
jgi:hypothetical protein